MPITREVFNKIREFYSTMIDKHYPKHNISHLTIDHKHEFITDMWLIIKNCRRSGISRISNSIDEYENVLQNDRLEGRQLELYFVNASTDSKFDEVQCEIECFIDQQLSYNTIL